jgi:hypothetical protein
MRRVRAGDESGAVAVMVGICLVMLIGFAAISVDVGGMYLERRELQNGADAAALAVALDCANNPTSAECTDAGARPIAESYANSNARDELHTIPAADGLVIDHGAQKVTVRTATNDPTNPDPSRLRHWFAPILGFDATEVNAAGAAIWGSIAGGSLNTLPLAFSLCEYNKFLAQPGTKYPAEEPWSSAPLPDGNGQPIIIFFHGDAEPCNDGPSGKDYPGGFGWLDPADGQCEANIVDGWMDGDTGISVPNECKGTLGDDILGQVVELPVFQDLKGTGSNAEYKFYSYAAFYVAGYSFPSMQDYLIDPYTGQKCECVKPDGSKCTGTDRHLIGWFTTSVAGGGEVDPTAPDTGVNTVQMTLP